MSLELTQQQPAVESLPKMLTRPGGQQPSGGWLVGPWFDILFLANVGWVVLFLAALCIGGEGQSRIQFWQIYFVTTPHRWITLGLVFLDSDRFLQRRFLFSGLAIGFITLCLGVQLATGQLTCLLMIDYVWNAWHFSAQHHGIYRIYERCGAYSSGGPMAWLEKWFFRGFLLYVIFRVAGASWGSPDTDRWLESIDVLSLLIPCGLIVREFYKTEWRRTGGTYYLLSVLGLYSSLLWAVHTGQMGIALLLTTLSALFHATEYLAIVSWSVQQRARVQGQRMGILGWLAPRWGFVIGVYLVILGSTGWMIEQGWFEAWLLLNVIVAFLHYAYDGLLWRRGRSSPTTVSSSGASSV
jgi:hypothetical protein